jgi:hypothetical protein
LMGIVACSWSDDIPLLERSVINSRTKSINGYFFLSKSWYWTF